MGFSSTSGAGLGSSAFGGGRGDCERAVSSAIMALTCWAAFSGNLEFLFLWARLKSFFRPLPPAALTISLCSFLCFRASGLVGSGDTMLSRASSKLRPSLGGGMGLSRPEAGAGGARWLVSLGGASGSFCSSVGVLGAGVSVVDSFGGSLGRLSSASVL